MEIFKKNKKLKLAFILTGSIILAGSISALAHQNFSGGYYGGQNYTMGCQTNLDEKTKEARDNLLNETTAIRKQLTIKQSELRALMSNEKPDSKAVGRITGEIFDLQEQLRSKIEKSGVSGIGLMSMMGPNHQFGNRYFGHGRGPWFNN